MRIWAHDYLGKPLFIASWKLKIKKNTMHFERNIYINSISVSDEKKFATTITETEKLLYYSLYLPYTIKESILLEHFSYFYLFIYKV